MLACHGRYAGTPACRNPLVPDGDGQCADACDGRIDLCEIATDFYAQTFTRPDLRLFSDDGARFEPRASDNDDSHNDALSFVVSFSARRVP